MMKRLYSFLSLSTISLHIAWVYSPLRKRSLFEIKFNTIDVKNMHPHRDSNPGPWNTVVHQTPPYL